MVEAKDEAAWMVEALSFDNHGVAIDARLMGAVGERILDAGVAHHLQRAQLFVDPDPANPGVFRLVVAQRIELRGGLFWGDRAGGDPAQDFTPISLAHGKTIKSDLLNCQSLFLFCASWNRLELGAGRQ